MDRGQSTLFPACLEDWIYEDNPVRSIDLFVDQLDLAKLSFVGVDPEATGRPSYHPSVLLKLYVYGYLNRVQSSRWLEREAGRNVEVMWLTGGLVPDHKTIADFRKDNGAAIRKVQSHARYEHHRCSAAPRGDEGVIALVYSFALNANVEDGLAPLKGSAGREKPAIVRNDEKRPYSPNLRRFHTTKTRSRHQRAKAATPSNGRSRWCCC